MSCLDGSTFTPDILAGRISDDADGIVLDLRGLPPPQPALCILQMLERKPLKIRAILDRNPVNLYDVLEEKGWLVSSTLALADGFQVVIERPPA